MMRTIGTLALLAVVLCMLTEPAQATEVKDAIQTLRESERGIPSEHAVKYAGADAASDQTTDLQKLDQEIAAAQATAASDGAVSTPTPQKGAAKTWWSVEDAMTISTVVLGFGWLIVVTASWLVLRGINAVLVLRMFGTMLVLVFTVFLVVAGYDDKQIAPALGLLGTVAGYLLGKSEEKNNDKGSPS